MVICVGNLTIDQAISPGGVRTEAVGGDALFAALGARLAGGDARILSPLGSDATPALLAALAAAGTDPASLPARDEVTVRNVIHYAGDGSRIWDLIHGKEHFEQLSVHPGDVPAWALAGDGVLMSAMGLRAQLALASWWRPRSRATVYFDPQEDYIAGNEGALMQAVATCDVFLPSEVEALALARTGDLSEAIERFLAAGPHTVVVKRAAAGALVATRERPDPVVVAAQVAQAVDATGAGDTFCGAFVAEHLRSRDALAAARAGAGAARVAVGGHGIAALLAAVTDQDLAHDQEAGVR